MAIIAVAAFVAVDVFAIITGHGEVIFSAIIALALIIAYFAPTLIAAQRGIPNAGSVAIVNLFLGWTCLGWIVAMAMAAAGNRPSAPVPLVPAWAEAATKKCPDCAKTVLSDARVCKHCGYRFAPSAPAAQHELAPGKFTKVRCHHCQHVQMVPRSLSTFVCEECNAKLKRHTG